MFFLRMMIYLKYLFTAVVTTANIPTDSSTTVLKSAELSNFIRLHSGERSTMKLP